MNTEKVIKSAAEYLVSVMPERDYSPADIAALNEALDFQIGGKKAAEAYRGAARKLLKDDIHSRLGLVRDFIGSSETSPGDRRDYKTERDELKAALRELK
jgi:hypothetical protein